MHLGMSYTELQRLPVRYRHWYVKRLSKHFEKKNEAAKSSVAKKSNNQDLPFSRIEEILKKKME